MSGLVLSEGFNLLPYRSRRGREVRRYRVAMFAAAGLAGWVAAGAVAGWDMLERARLEEQRATLETSLRASASPTEEHARLVRIEVERRNARQGAVPMAVPRERFLALLEALADAPTERGVTLQRVSQRTDEVELAALAPDSQTAARWLKRLEDVRDVQAVEVVDMKRRVDAALSDKRNAHTSGPERFEFTALVCYARSEATANAAKRQANQAESKGKRS